MTDPTYTAADPVPAWVHMAEVPPDTDDEPWRHDPDAPTGAPVAWGCLALLLLTVIVVVAWRLRA